MKDMNKEYRHGYSIKKKEEYGDKILFESRKSYKNFSKICKI